MYNLIVLGCGRSGTSMVTGTLATAGYSTGEVLWPADEHNPRGYYEERDLLELNPKSSRRNWHLLSRRERTIILMP